MKAVITRNEQCETSVDMDVMQVTAGQILERLDDPEALEKLYRSAPDEFMQSLDEAAYVTPDSPVLRVWSARLRYRESDHASERRLKLIYAIGFALLCGAMVRLPAIWLSEEWYYPRLAPSLVILSLAAYFWMEHRHRFQLFAGLGLISAVAVYVCNLPTYSDSVVMALVHLPVIFWIFLGWVFVGKSWSDTNSRIHFVRFNGELLILGSLVGLGGMVFSGVTVALFGLIFEDVEEVYFRNVGVFGATTVPIAGAFLYDAIFNNRLRVASILAQIFAPLFLIMALVYLAIAFIGGQNPFTDRSFLITVNGLLLVVLGIAVFSIVERNKESSIGLIDYVNFALLVVTLLIDAIALSAIVFRLASFGFSPNRVVVLGANLTIIFHLAWMCWTYLGLLRHRSGFDDLRRVVAGYLPAYGVWAVIVVFILPAIFRFS